MLKIIGTELKLISESNMHDFIEEEMREGISYIAKRYSKANNKYMIDHESSEEVNSLFIQKQTIYMVGYESIFTLW